MAASSDQGSGVLRAPRDAHVGRGAGRRLGLGGHPPRSLKSRPEDTWRTSWTPLRLQPFPWLHLHCGVSPELPMAGLTLVQLPRSPQDKPCPQARPTLLWWPPVGLPSLHSDCLDITERHHRCLLWPWRAWRRSLTAATLITGKALGTGPAWRALPQLLWCCPRARPQRPHPPSCVAWPFTWLRQLPSARPALHRCCELGAVALH